ncbi:energy transducer TonB [Winogradskyella sp. R77965]|uniref:energy transducer TonB n=1 Tax=Winogradskyella sp. R77965 TaxID=3093872 RepID=UPI0037DC3700
MLYTILQIIAFQALFLLVYDLFLKRETFFNYNRAYLLISSVLSLALPFIRFPELKAVTTKDFVIQLPEVFIGTKTPTAFDVQIAEQAGLVIEQSQTPTWYAVLLAGIAIATFIFIFKISKLYWLKFNNPKRWKGNLLIVNLIKSSAAFSFFSTIFIGERIPETEKPTIYKHELVHIKDLHTLDLLFFELLRIIFWFNPLVYIYQNRIKELHEYIADAKAVKQNGKADYYQSLLNQVFDVNNVSFTNTFFKKSLIKKRITMLQKSKSKQLNLIKYALLIPMVFGMLIYTSAEVRAQQNVEKQEQSVDQELTEEELIKKYYDELVKMDKDGATYFQIAEYAGFKKENSYKYTLSKEDFLKSKALLKYISENRIIQRQSKDGTSIYYHQMVSPEKLKILGYRTYQHYREWKKTKEAKNLWEANVRNGVLKLFVEDGANMSEKEKNRFDALMNQLETDTYYKKLVVADESTLLILDAPNKSETEIIEVEEVNESVEVPFSVVEIVPTLKECADLETNKERKYCMTSFVNKHVGQNFNTKLADSLNPGKKRIFVHFKIDKEGNVKDIKARAPSEALEEEVKRVLNMLPQFAPGKQKGKLVTVPYSLPIVFEVKGDDKRLKELIAERERILRNSSDKNPVVVRLSKQIDALKAKSKNTTDSLRINNYQNKRLKELIAQRDRLLRNSSEKNPVVKILNKQIDSIGKEKTKKEKLYLKLLEQQERQKIEEAKIIEVTKDETDKIPFREVDESPIHPDCNSLSLESDKKDCTIHAVNKHMGKNFNTSLAKSLDLPAGRQRISTQFVINKKGNVTKIKVEGPHPKLEEEVERVLKLLPQFMPGKKDGKVVNVPLSIPIVFSVADTKKD